MPDATRTIYQRIEAARQHFPTITRQAKGQVGTREYHYADIGAVVDGVEAPLRAEGVGIFPTVEDGSVVTRLVAYDSPGDEHVHCAIALPPDLTPQQVGSAITYYRRYALVLLLNLLTEDDDGSSASRPVPPEAQVTEVAAPEGWESPEAAALAHKALSARIAALPDEQKAPLVEFRQEHGWPLTLPLFEELESIVKVIEEFLPTETPA